MLQCVVECDRVHRRIISSVAPVFSTCFSKLFDGHHVCINAFSYSQVAIISRLFLPLLALLYNLPSFFSSLCRRLNNRHWQISTIRNISRGPNLSESVQVERLFLVVIWKSGKPSPTFDQFDEKCRVEDTFSCNSQLSRCRFLDLSVAFFSPSTRRSTRKHGRNRL